MFERIFDVNALHSWVNNKKQAEYTDHSVINKKLWTASSSAFFDKYFQAKSFQMSMTFDLNKMQFWNCCSCENCTVNNAINSPFYDSNSIHYTMRSRMQKWTCNGCFQYSMQQITGPNHDRTCKLKKLRKISPALDVESFLPNTNFSIKSRTVILKLYSYC